MRMCVHVCVCVCVCMCVQMTVKRTFYCTANHTAPMTLVASFPGHMEVWGPGNEAKTLATGLT